MLTANHSPDSVLGSDRTQRSRLPLTCEAEATILFATDLSQSSRAGLSWATALAKQCQARILLLYVEVPPVPSEDLIYLDLTNSRASARATLRGFLPTDPTLQATYRVLVGDPAQQIINVAEQENVGLIVLGNHQRKGLQRFLKGSVTETVLRRASCPVFVFRQDSSE